MRRRTNHPLRLGGRARAALRLAPVALCLLLVPATVAFGSWSSGSSGAAAVKARQMPSGSQPSATVSNRSVTVTWSAASFSGGPAVDGYVVRRYSSGGAVQTIGSGCSGTVSALSCTETAVPSGSWHYTITPKHGNWLGAESAQSSVTTVQAAALSFSSSTTLASLPVTLAGTIANFVPGQTVAYRLDNSTSGTVLTGSISPSPVQSSGDATVSVTIPTGTSNGAHTVYAIGSSGDVASAAITVSAPVSGTVSTSAWDLRDASAGAAEVDATFQTAAADARTFATGTWDAAFGTKYFEFDMNDPLISGQTVSGAAFNFRFAAAAAGEQACFYFELRSASTGTSISTHGSAAAPVQCVTGTTQQTVTTNLPALDTSAEANDARIRVYARESAAKLITIDMATITATVASTSFTLHATRYVDGTVATPATTRWGPAVSGDGAAYTNPVNWAATFATTRYLKFTFPAYVPSGATVTSATLQHYYRPTTSGRNACWYFEIYAGATLIGTYGSSAAPVSCNSTTTYTTDSITLTQVNTPARANSLVVRAYYNISGNGVRTTQHDLVKLNVNYTQ